MERISTIKLCQAIPQVFGREDVIGSEIWLCERTFCRGEYSLVEARSGGGKSSMICFLYGSRRDFSGTILFNGKDTLSLSVEEWQEIRRRHLAYLPQDLMLFPELTAMENIELKNELTGYQSESRIRNWLDALGLGDRVDWPVGKLSVGQMQRVALIRSLCQPFDFLLLDEPVSHLDETNNRIAATIIAEEAMRQDAGIIATSVGNPITLNYHHRHSL